MTQPQRTTTQRPTLELLDSDHPHFRAGAPIAAQVAHGKLTQLGIYAVRSIAIDRKDGRVVIQTAQEYLFVATIASYDALLALPEARAIPWDLYTDHAPRLGCIAETWLGRSEVY